MAKQRFKKAVAVIGKYQDHEGKEKNRYLTVGVLLKDPETGGLSLKLDAMPLGEEWGGWINFFDFETAEQRAARGNGQPQQGRLNTGDSTGQTPNSSTGAGAAETFDDDIPF